MDRKGSIIIPRVYRLDYSISLKGEKEIYALSRGHDVDVPSSVKGSEDAVYCLNRVIEELTAIRDMIDSRVNGHAPAPAKRKRITES